MRPFVLLILALLALPAAAGAQDAPPAEPTPARRFGETPAISIVEDSFIGLALRSDRDVQLVGMVALAVAFAVHENVSVGLYRLHVAAGLDVLETGIYGIGGAPGVEVGFFPDPRVQPFARVAALLQGRTQSEAREGVFQAALDVVLGVRIWILRLFAVAPSLGVDVALTDALLVGDVALPQGTTVLTLGLELGVHLPL